MSRGELDRLLDRIDRLEKRERFGDALAEARRGCGLDPDEPALWEARGELALRSGELEESAQALDRLTRMEPGSAGAWFSLGEALQWSGRGEAEECFRLAARLDPGRHVVPFRISAAEFEVVAGSVLPSLPARVIDFLEDTGTGVTARPLPALEMVVDEHLDPHALGYWLGNVYGVAGAWGQANPAAIEIYQLNIENWCPDRATLAEEIRRTVLHEVGHAVGMDHVDLQADGY
jgi:predicted Zn-dependent protease with MMP-like domain